MTSATRRIAAFLAVGAAAALTACSTPLSSGPPPVTTGAPTTTTIPGSATPAQTKAADYRAQLTYLMVEQVYVLSRVTQAIVAATPEPAGGGVSGASGASGVSGVSGASGASGVSGVSGASGVSGVSGVSGASGASGVSGVSGASAAPGALRPGGGAGGAVTPGLFGGTGPALPTTAAVADATAALATSSTDIAAWLAQAQGYGADFEAAFVPLWQARNTDFENYATAKAANDTAGAKAATDTLATNATALGTLLHNTNKYIAITTVTNPPTGFADELTTDNGTVTTFIADQASAATTTATDTVTAAEKMYHTADFLAAATAKLDPDYTGTATGTAANMRSSLTMAWVEHVELAALNIDEIADGHKTGIWSAALDANTQQLENAMTTNLGDQAARQFGSVWGAYIGALRTYTLALTSGDAASAGTARSQLAGSAQTIGAFFAGQGIGLDANVLTGEVQPIVGGLQLVADAATSQAPQGTPIRTAAGYVPKLASDIAEAFALAKPNLYAP